MKTKKKNRFLTFCFSCIPGAGEMYMGFFKTGLSLMLLFVLIIVVSVFTNQDVIVAVAVVAWAYSFFHANHLASLADEDFAAVQDQYLFGLEDVPELQKLKGKYQKVIAYALIFIGLCFLWDSVANLLHYTLPDMYQFIPRLMWRIGDYIPSLIIAVAVICLGVKMLKGKPAELAGQQQEKNGEE